MIVLADTSPAGSGARFQQLLDQMRTVPGVASVSAPVTSPSQQAMLATVTPATGPQDPATAHLVHQLRDEVVPPSGLHVEVTGQTAGGIDFTDACRPGCRSSSVPSWAPASCCCWPCSARSSFR